MSKKRRKTIKGGGSKFQPRILKFKGVLVDGVSYELTTHARARCAERKVTVEDLHEALRKGALEDNRGEYRHGGIRIVVDRTHAKRVYIKTVMREKL